ncbi:MAG: HypC/HybG/HupF family hydrogenase formation chaperone [Lachnospiraceae bacterium]|jgi:hydrogenase expression/formation protein HypC|nr:HypC/HybG/HupF family hydrogenase formation chaperone [Lachnospiraceae bacterium]MCH4108455.1 HypC/HybG/HupF family hydrogenase formation chaperone [Lachnospiraceae bacterium]MCI1302530.1 HypC/HybG/HupF family hydrogenase formation chaperone [Lachnospiraceae bacterium]MCI1331703.1 HypC/HybG/HupF family hydrogenase formation chaperone [Lachnospiraceae bacterium]MCI1360961.1 HypC/HybG/HupF family hydrogenase formation chaperone [Lachnospiraceae bacterium]
MCVALPGRVVSVDGEYAQVDFEGNEVRALAGLVKVKPGDRVLVHAGCILQKLAADEADSMEEIFREIGEEFA